MIQQIRVRTDLLDNVIPKVSIRFIKIDVEGAELQVLKGAIKTICRSKPIIVFEHGLGAADYYNTRPEDIFDLLTSNPRLRISTLDKWLNGEKELSRKQFSKQFHERVNFYFIAYP